MFFLLKFRDFALVGNFSSHIPSLSEQTNKMDQDWNKTIRILRSINPRLTKLFYTTSTTIYNQGGGYHPLWEFVMKHPMLMTSTVVPMVSYGPPLNNDTKRVPTFPIPAQLWRHTEEFPQNIMYIENAHKVYRKSEFWLKIIETSDFHWIFL